MNAKDVLELFLELAERDQVLAAVIPVVQVQLSAADGQEADIVDILDHGLQIYALARTGQEIWALPELTS